MKKSSSWQIIFLIILALVMVLSITLPSMALNWAGEGTNGGSASASSNGSHTIPYGSAGKNVYGFRFTAIDSNGYRRGSQKSLDVWVKSHETAYLERARANKLFYKGEYANNWLDYKEGTDDSVGLDKVSTEPSFKEQMAKESEMGFKTALPAGNVNYGDAFKTWADRDENCDVLAKALGYENGISSMGSDIIVVEPIFACKIDGEDVLMTVTEIACFGRDKYGAYQDGTMGGTNSGKFGFISRFTNMEFPNLLYVTSYSGTYLGEDAEGALTGRGTFDEIISKSYGVGIIYGDTAYTSYTLTIDPNGGKWMNETMVRSYQMKAYALRTIKAPTRSGYTFTGWKIESSGGCTLGGQSSGTSKSTNYKQGTGNCTLTAQWKQNTTYDLTLVGDEGVESFTTEDGTDAGGGVYTGFASGARPSCTVVLKEGYRLVEITGTGYNGSGTWNESSEGRLPATGSYTTTFTMKGNRTLYAVTEPTFRTLTVIGDEGIQEITGAGQYAYGAVPTVTVTAKPGYTLSHYYGTTHDGSGNATWQIAAGKTYDSDTWGLYADRTIYVYSKPIDYTLTYDPNGGSVTPGSTTFTYSGALTNLAVPTRAGYTFNRWYAEFNGSNYINLGRDYMYTDKLSMHLEAYMDDWSTCCTKNMRLISCTEGGGWNIESGNYNIAFGIYDAGVGYKSVTTSKTWASLSAGWHSFDLVFDGSYAYCYVDGTLVGTSVKFSSGKIGYHASNSIILGAEAGGSSTAVDGNYFTGRIANLSITHSSTLVTSTTSQFMAPAQDFTLKAEWTPIQYTVVYKPNGAPGSDWSNTVTTGSNYTVEENWYSRTGYIFTGWSTNPNGDDGYGWTGWSGTWNYVNGQYGVSNNTLTLYAQWTPIQYTVVYKPNGASGSDLSNTVTTGSNYAVKENWYSYTGYRFTGWSTNPDGDDGYGWTGWSGTWNYVNGQYGVSNNTLTLYAQWTPINYTITYDPNGGTLAGSATQGYNIATNVTLQAAPTRTGYTFAGWKLSTDTGNWTAGTYAVSKECWHGQVWQHHPRCPVDTY